MKKNSNRTKIYLNKNNLTNLLQKFKK